MFECRKMGCHGMHDGWGSLIMVLLGIGGLSWLNNVK